MSTHLLFTALEEVVDRNPAAVLIREPGPDGGRVLTRGEFLDLVHRCTTTLADAGVGAGDCVAVWLPNWSSTLAFQFAVSALGAHVVGVNTRYNETEVGHVLRKASPRVLVMAHAFRGLNLMDRARSALVHVGVDAPVVLPLAPPGVDAAPDQDFDLGAGTVQLANSGGHSPAARPQVPAPVTVAFTTSGSTGMPKVAGHSEEGVLHHAEAVQRSANIDEGTVLIGPLPFSGVFGYNPIVATLLAGGVVVLHPAFDEDALLREMSEFGVTHFVGADDMLVRLRAAWDRSPADLSTWRVLLMADFLGKTREIGEWTRAEFGTEAYGVYGSSEVFSLMAHWPAGTPEPQRWLGGGALVSDEYAYRLVDDEGLPGASEGALEVRGPTVTDAYLGDEGEGASAVTPDGWFRTGDLARAVTDRSFEYVCRAGDALRLKGFLVEPAEIEARLLEHPSVQVAKVVGVTSQSSEPVAVGFVTLHPGHEVAGETLVDWCRKALARFKVPVRVDVLEAMPTTVGTNGAKIKASELRELAKQLV